MSSFDDDELDGELRRLFTDDRLGVQPEAGTKQAIVAGAQRLRRRRAILTSATGVTLAVMMVGGVVTVGSLRGHHQTVDVASQPLETTSADGVHPTALSTVPPAPSDPSTQFTVVEPVIPQSPTPTPPPSRRNDMPPVTNPKVAGKPTMPKYVGPELNAAGYGNLKLGMTAAQAAAQGVTLTQTGSTASCSSFDIAGSGVPSTGSIAISAANGLVAIAPDAPVHTPEGIGQGSSEDDVFTAYPGATDGGTGGLTAPAGVTSTYSFSVNNSQQVENVNLSSDNQDCAA
ncbi:MAG: hypothetical protein JWQ81_6296 [Amycolatopsis sp.]|uniref:hypothetical protein n=1 Tax=Amycolatopsis sp. TaxID=37632 RepID=UPI002618953C|nr:hypothetical protein [Amycolatopsis sp.]MCU1685557.1 hypothetical protein [Amycolatopsis sp.]